MVDFIIKRPIGVTMLFLSIMLLGIVSLWRMPISLMPDIDIPEVTVQVSSGNTAARELENTVVKPLRRQLLQTSHLASINSETRDEQAFITLRFDYGTDADYAFIEVNEKIDQTLSRLPNTLERPRAMKSSAMDVPVFYLNLRLKPEESFGKLDAEKPKTDVVSTGFIELSRFSEQVIRKRIEQLPEVSLVDMSGMLYAELLIIPDLQKIGALNISHKDIEQLISNNNIKLGNLLIKDGQYEYNVQIDTEITNIRDLGELILNREGQLFKLNELAQIIERPQQRRGIVSIDGQDAITMGIIQQGDAQMRSLKTALNDLIVVFKKDYPHIVFEISQDQSEVLEFSIASLRSSLVWGVLLAFMIMFFFMRDFRSPLLIGISVPVAVVMTILTFHLFGVTINIISLSGLILGVGMMIDNSIIVIDNITQFRARGLSVIQACVRGTVEVIKPLLSSVLTTCAVFVPLIFLSGVAGTLFYDQAMAVSLGLFVSLIVSITLLPVYYAIFYRRNRELWLDRKLREMNTLNYERLYEKGFRWVMRHQVVSWGVFIGLLLGTFLLYRVLPKQQMPDISRNDFVMQIDWNDRIHIDENRQRTDALLANFDEAMVQNVSLVGHQQFMLRNDEKSTSETTIYVKTDDPSTVDDLQKQLSTYLAKQYPKSLVDFDQSANVFDLIFANEQAPFIVKLNVQGNLGENGNQELEKIHAYLKSNYPEEHIEPIAWDEQLSLIIDNHKASLYGIDRNQIITSLKQAFNAHEVLLITSGQEFVPVIIGGGSKSIRQVMSDVFVTSKDGQDYPIRLFLNSQVDYDLKTIVAGSDGTYFPIDFDVDKKQAETIREDIQDHLTSNTVYKPTFEGSLYENETLVYEMAGVLSVALLLLYFILAAQFESVTVPLIVLIEVPIDLAGAFLMLKLFGSGINLMSMIGMVVMSGIIINDSILKIDTINQLLKEGMSVMKAMLLAGQRRLKPILMTSFTTVLALFPVLLSGGLGADLQKPLALAVIGGMVLGTLVSLYFIPLCYYYLTKNKF